MTKQIRVPTTALMLFCLLCAAGGRADSHEMGLSATSQMEPKSGSAVSGTLHLHQRGDAVHLSGEIRGLAPGPHGLHIHANGNCDAADGTSAGHVFNPTGARRRAVRPEKGPLGDLGNIEADAEGIIRLDLLVEGATIALMGSNSIAERALVIFEGADDGSDPDGNSGRRIACGFIEQDMMRM